MSLHKLTAGNGYTYLTRQVAAADATDKGHTSLDDFYAQRGESPGVWVGSGLSGLDGVDAGAHVSGAQMKALFGEGLHPDADRIGAAMIAAGHSPAEAERASALGRRYCVYLQRSPLRAEVAQRLAAHNTSLGQRPEAPIPFDVRARIRTDVGERLFADKHGRPPADARELRRFVARSWRVTTAVAGFDLTFSPVKSVSALWALAPPPVAAQIQQAQSAAVADTLRWLERDATFTRVGGRRTSQIVVAALVGTAFTHRDARSGDPDLHTHVAISNKVQSPDGTWLALDGRPLIKAKVAACERYNTRIEAELRARLGVRFQARPASAPGRRPIREVVGVNARLNQFWSSRAADIKVRLAVLAATFQVDHARPPNSVESQRLDQQATLETRPRKHSPRSYAEQRATWSAQAQGVLGGEDAVQEMIAAALAGGRPGQRAGGPRAGGHRVTGQWVDEVAAQVVARVSRSHPSWQIWHVRAEAERRARTAEVALADLDSAVDQVVARALSPAHAVPVGGPRHILEPDIRRRDGSSIYTVPGAQRFISQSVIDEVVAHADRLEPVAKRVDIGAAQRQLVQDPATSGAHGQPAIGHGSPPEQPVADMTADIHATGGQRHGVAGAGHTPARQVAAATDAAPPNGCEPAPGPAGDAPHRATGPVEPADLGPHPGATPAVAGAAARAGDEPPPRQSPPAVEGYHEALFHAARQREYTPAPDLDAMDTDRQLAEANRWDHAPVSRRRLLELNEMAADFFTAGYADSWGPGYVGARLGTDLAGHRGFRVGYAPAGWANLSEHLRRLGVRDQEILAAGLGRVASTGRVIDHFRDRLVVPIRNGDQIHGFIGRRNPTPSDPGHTGPKYLNTAQTDLFDKSAQLFGLSEGAGELDAGASPVLVEGFLDAIAVTLAGAGRYVGLAPLGTSLTAAQANQLRPYIGGERRGVAVATDADLAGQIGAQRAFWMLTARGDAPLLVAMPDAADPAAVLQHAGPAGLRAALIDAQPLALLLLDERLTRPGEELRVLADCAVVIAAQPPHTWMEQIEYLSARTNHGPALVYQGVADAAARWTLDPLGGAGEQIGELAGIRARLQRGARAPRPGDLLSGLGSTAQVADPARPDSGRSQAANSSSKTGPAPGAKTAQPWPRRGWRQLAHSIDARLTAGQDWSVLRRAIQEADAAGCDVARELGGLAAQGELSGEHPAAELAYRLRAATQTFSDTEPAPARAQKPGALGSGASPAGHASTSRRPTSPPVR